MGTIHDFIGTIHDFHGNNHGGKMSLQISSPLRNLCQKLLLLPFRPSYDWMRNMSVRNPATHLVQKQSLVFNQLQPDELAEQLTFLEYKAFRRITVSCPMFSVNHYHPGLSGPKTL
jgi:hypothetical protein